LFLRFRAAGIAARANYTDRDFVDFLVNVECLEGQFDTWGTFGHGFLGARASQVVISSVTALLLSAANYTDNFASRPAFHSAASSSDHDDDA